MVHNLAETVTLSVPVSVEAVVEVVESGATQPEAAAEQQQPVPDLLPLLLAAQEIKGHIGTRCLDCMAVEVVVEPQAYKVTEVMDLLQAALQQAQQAVQVVEVELLVTLHLLAEVVEVLVFLPAQQVQAG
jgi:hypothetical protein